MPELECRTGTSVNKSWNNWKKQGFPWRESAWGPVSQYQTPGGQGTHWALLWIQSQNKSMPRSMGLGVAAQLQSSPPATLEHKARMESWPSRTQVTWCHLAPPLWVYDLSLGISQARDTHTATIQVSAWRIMLSRNPQPSSLADANPHTNPPHHCNAAIQPGTWPLHPASIHLIGTISWEPLTVALLSVPMF